MTFTCWHRLSGEERPKIICIGLNYADHAAESGSKVPDEPMMFAKYYTTLCGPGDNIVAPLNHSKLDYEVELVIVVGKRASRVPQAKRTTTSPAIPVAMTSASVPSNAAMVSGCAPSPAIRLLPSGR